MREYALTFVIAVAVTYLLTPLVRRGAIAFKAVPAVRDRDVHSEPIPQLGGIAMYAGVVAALLISYRLPHLSEVFLGPTWEGLLLAGALITLVGIVDDRWGMDPLPKLAGQVAAAGILVWKGVQLLWIPLPGTTLVLGPELGTVLSVLLIVVTINAVNFADGLDGLAAGIVAISAFAFFAYYYVVAVDQGFTRQTYPAMIAIILAGVCIGFLFHNFHPARIFMGDTGAMLIGLLLASITITVTGQFDANTARELSTGGVFDSGLVVYLPVVLPLLVLALPFLDLLLAVLRRTLAGQSPVAPDRKHLHHRMLELGHSHLRAVLLMYLWAAIIAFAAVTLSVFSAPYLVLTVTALVAICALLLVTWPRLRRRRARQRRESGQTTPDADIKYK